MPASNRANILASFIKQNKDATFAKYPTLKTITRGNAAPARSDAMAATLRAAATRLPSPLTDQQVQRQAQAMIDPALNALRQRVNSFAAAGTQAVGSLTDQLAKQLAAGVDTTREAFVPSLAASAAANNALANRLETGGNEDADALAKRLADINAPAAVDPAVAEARRFGEGSGNALYGVGNASLQDLIGRQASAVEYADKLPGIARLTGLQQAAGVRSAANQTLAEGLGDIYGQLPSIVESLRARSDARAAAIEQAQENQQGRQDARRAQLVDAIITTGYDPATGTLTAAAQKALARVLGPELQGAFSGTTASAAAANIAATQRQAAEDEANKPRFNASNSRAVGYRTDQYGNPIPDAQGRLQPLPGYKLNKAGTGVVKESTTKKKAAPSASDRRQWASLARDFRHGEPPKFHFVNGEAQEVPGTGSPPLTYDEAIRQLMAAGAPRDVAVALANANYKPGEFGRPFTAPPLSAGAAAKRRT